MGHIMAGIDYRHSRNVSRQPIFVDLRCTREGVCTQRLKDPLLPLSKHNQTNQEAPGLDLESVKAGAPKKRVCKSLGGLVGSRRAFFCCAGP